MPVIKISVMQRGISTVLEIFALKRKETTQTDPPRKHPRNARGISAEELGTMSKNNLAGITLGVRLI